MPKRELQFTEGKSEKFWTITLKGKTHTVVYGRIGTAGRTLSKSFDTSSEAKASYESLIESKLNKGYRDAASNKIRPAKITKKKPTLLAKSKKKRVQPSCESGDTGIALNDLTRRMNMHNCQFRNKRDMANHCHYVWMRLFWHLRTQEPWIDVAMWEIGSTTFVRPACTALDESNRSFVRPHPIYFEVKGYNQEKRKVEKQKDIDAATIEREQQALERELMEQMQEAMLKGFEYKHTQESFSKYNPDDRPFTMLITTQDKGLHASDFTVVWKNRRGLSAAQIRKKAAAVKGKKPAIKKQEESAAERHRNKLAVERKKESKEYREYWQQEKENAEKRKPAVRKKLTTQIEQAEAKLSRQTRTKAKRKTSSQKEFLLCLDDGNQRERQLAPTIKLDKLVDIVATYKWANFDEYDNRMWEYMTTLINPLYKNRKLSRRALWQKLNRAQKVFYVLLDFIGETDNGGVWQFLFNSPEYLLAALEAMNEVGATKLARDYQATLEEYSGKVQSLSDMRKRFDDKNLSSKKQWQAFAEGYQDLKTAAKIQKYFYTAKFKKTLYKQMSDYIEESYPLFAKVKV